MVKHGSPTRDARPAGVNLVYADRPTVVCGSGFNLPSLLKRPGHRVRAFSLARSRPAKHLSPREPRTLANKRRRFSWTLVCPQYDALIRRTFGGIQQDA